jgi:hypothetical protein
VVAKKDDSGNGGGKGGSSTGAKVRGGGDEIDIEDDHLEEQFAFDYMHRNKRAVEVGFFFTGITLLTFGLYNYMQIGYFDQGLNLLGMYFILQYMFFLVKREFFWTHFMTVILVFQMFGFLLLAFWTCFVEPAYLPGYNRQCDCYKPDGDLGNPVLQNL